MSRDTQSNAFELLTELKLPTNGRWWHSSFQTEEPEKLIKTRRPSETLHTLDFTLSAGDIAELERAVEAIPVIGDRYDAEQQKRVLG